MLAMFASVRVVRNRQEACRRTNESICYISLFRRFLLQSVEDVFVRVRQLLSKLETQYSGEEIVVVAPDSDTLSILEAALRNVPLEKHRQVCSYAPGELRKVEPMIVKDS